MNIFYPFDLALMVWQQILIILVHSPWLVMIPIAVALVGDYLGKKLDKKRHP